MTCEMKIISATPQSANITLTNEYLVVNGPHYSIFNGYISSTKETKAIKVKDVLNIEYVTLRSKRLLMAFVILMSIVIFGSTGIKLVSSVVTNVTQETQFTEDEDDYGQNSIREKNAKRRAVRIIIYGILMVSSACCIVSYFLKPFQLLYISSSGNMIAVKRRYYDKRQLDNLIGLWRYEL